MNSTNRRDSPARWLFAMLILGGLAAGLGPIGGFIALAVGAPLVGFLWWKERTRWVFRKRVNEHARFERIDADVIRLTHDGFRWKLPSGAAASIGWADVRGFAAFVEPQPAGDALMLALQLAPFDGWIAFSSDMEGFDFLRLALKDRFGVPPGWEEAVWRRPNGLNWRRLWGDAPPPGDKCWKCRYDLRGNESGVCPECGTVFVWPEPQRTKNTSADFTD